MSGFEKARKNLEAHDFDVTCLGTVAETAGYLDRRLDGKTVGHGGPIILKKLGLLDRLQSHAMMRSHWPGDNFVDVAAAPVYLTSVSALAETGELVNIDSTGNRVVSTIFGHEEVYFIVGINKLAPDYDVALWRARNVASSKNARRLGRKIPYAARGDKCYDCKSPERICRALAVLWERPTGIGQAEVVPVNEPLGYRGEEGVVLKRSMAAALALSCAPLPTGCSFLLENPYVVVEPHTERPVTAEDSSTVQVGTYSELVNTVLFLVFQGTERGLIQLTDDYDGDVEEDLNRVCLEVTKDNSLGAYAVGFIKNSYTRVLTAYETIIITSYRRTREQIRSLVNATGTSATRDEARAALADFQSKVALRAGYFTESVDSIAALVRQVYYDEPIGALGMLEFTVSLYPVPGGQQRIAEILLTYPEDIQALRQKNDDLQSTTGVLVFPLRPHQLSPSARQAELLSLVREHVRARPDGGPTIWDALLGDRADSKGLVLVFQLLSGKMGVGPALMEDTLNGEPHFWNQLTADDGAHYVDLIRDASGTTCSAADLLSLGYV